LKKIKNLFGTTREFKYDIDAYCSSFSCKKLYLDFLPFSPQFFSFLMNETVIPFEEVSISTLCREFASTCSHHVPPDGWTTWHWGKKT
jgi:hypothetical protein